MYDLFHVECFYVLLKCPHLFTVEHDSQYKSFILFGDNHSLLCNQVAMRALGFDVKKSDVLKILKDYDREATGKIVFDDFQEVSM